MDGLASVYGWVESENDSTTSLGQVSLSSGESHELLGSVFLHSTSHFLQGYQRIRVIIVFIE